MKQRIIEELRKLAKGEDSNHIVHLAKRLNRNEAWVRERSKIIYNRLLHQYHDFNIQTIDSFFQRIIRGFAKDIGLSAGFRLEMDTDLVLEESINKMMDELKPDTNLTKWIAQFSRELADESKNWDIRAQLFAFAKHIFKEEFIELEPQIAAFVDDKEKIHQLSEQINVQIRSFRQQLEIWAKDGEALLNKHHLAPNDFSGKGRSFMQIFQKIKAHDFSLTDTFCNSIGYLEKWYAKTTDKDIIDRIQALYPEINPLLEKIYIYINDHGQHYFSALLAKENLYQLGILSEIQSYIRRYRDEHEVILMSDTAALIYRIIQNNEESFVYEKAGTYYHHFLLDEFQDTSSLQWKNFKPLISNSISQGYLCMLVGDVKQSIYRFRNGDWRLLMYHAEQDIPIHQVIQLNINYRSAIEIVRFNNTLFSSLPQMLGRQFTREFENNNIQSDAYRWFVDAYQGQQQHYNSKLTGYVLVRNMHAEAEETEIDWQDLVIEDIILQITDAISRNYQPRDIVLLCRNGKEAALLFNQLTKAELNTGIISEESLKISNNSYVQLIISAIKLIAGVNASIQTGHMITQYALYLTENNADHLHQFILFPPPPIRYVIENKDTISQQTIKDMIATLHVVFNDAGLFRKEDETFFQAFCDESIQYHNEYGGVLSQFIEWWDNEGQLKTIKLSETQNAIRILTIHKSKGLEFPVVILPFCSWSLDHRSNSDKKLWVRPHKDLRWQTPLIPIKYKQDTLKTYFGKEYMEEKSAAYLDNLNLLYVALTRAENELYIYLKTPDNIIEHKNVSSLLWNGLTSPAIEDKNNIFTDFSLSLDVPNACLELGEKTNKVSKSSDKDIAPMYVQDFTYGYPWKNTRLRKTPETKKPWQEKGLAVHDLLSRMRTFDDAKTIIKLYSDTAYFDADEITFYNQLIEQLDAHPISKGWFEKNNLVLTEQPLIQEDGRVLRPDRMIFGNESVIIVDFKTGDPNVSHIEQVKAYCQVASRIYKKKAIGYLYYIASNSIEEINQTA